MRAPFPTADHETRSSAMPHASRGVDVTRWTDAQRVLLCSALTLPFALGWMLRIERVALDPLLSPYVSRPFIPVLLPILRFQLIGHALLVLLALADIARRRRRSPWLVHAEIQFWITCGSVSLYVVGPFTSSFAVLLLALPILGHLLFDARAMRFGIVTLVCELAFVVALPQLGIVPYAPFLTHAPFADGELHPAWVASIGVPTIFVTALVIVFQSALVRKLRERQAELERLSSTDVLTGLANRTVFLARLAAEASRARRHGYPLCLLMLDVDHFKTINDTHGHLAGDDVLRRLGAALARSLRIDDVAARYGGEEFAILLPHTGIDEAQVVSDRLRDAVREIRVGAAGDRVTVSVGVAAFEPEGREQDVIARADAALYDSKRGGRDRVTVAIPGPSHATGTAVPADRSA